MATTNKVQGWLCLLMTEDSSFHWPTKPQTSLIRNVPARPVLSSFVFLDRTPSTLPAKENWHQSGESYRSAGPASSEVGGVAAVVQSKLTTCSVYKCATLVAVAVRRQHHDTRRT